MLQFPKVPFLVLYFSYYKLMAFQMIYFVILLSKLMTLLFTQQLQQQLELASKLESDIQDTVDQGRKWLVDFNVEKTQFVSFDQFNNTGAINKEIDKSVIEENHLLKCWECLILLNQIWAVTVFLLLKLPPRKLKP